MRARTKYLISRFLKGLAIIIICMLCGAIVAYIAPLLVTSATQTPETHVRAAAIGTNLIGCSLAQQMLGLKNYWPMPGWLSFIVGGFAGLIGALLVFFLVP